MAEKMSVEKHAIRLSEVYQRARTAVVRDLDGWRGDGYREKAAHAIAMLLVQQALTEAILAEWIKPEPEVKGG